MKSFIRNTTMMQYKNMKLISFKVNAENPVNPIKQMMNTINMFMPIAIVKNLLGIDDQKCLFSLMLNKEK